MRLFQQLRLRLRSPTGSELDRLIRPEVTGDRLYAILTDLAATPGLRHILEIGSSSGAGSNKALVEGVERNPANPYLHCIELSQVRFAQLVARYRTRPFVHCYHTSSVPVERFPTPSTVERFYREAPSRLRRVPLSEVLRWLEQDLDYIRTHGMSARRIEQVRRTHGVDVFDLVFIDGSEFAGTAELDEVYGARLVVLDDTQTFKNMRNYQRPNSDPGYRLVEEYGRLRNGFAVFERVS